MLPARPVRSMMYGSDLRTLNPHSQFNSWYSAPSHCVTLQVPDSIPSHGSSPQSSNGSLVNTPYQTSGTIAEIGNETAYGYGRLQSTPTVPVNGLGLMLSESRKPSPLNGIYGHGSNGLTVPVDYHHDGHNHDMNHWQETSPAYQTGTGSSYDLYPPSRSQSNYHSRSYSDNDSTENLPSSSSSSTNFSSGGSPFGSHRDTLPPLNRSNSLPPVMSEDVYSLPPSTHLWNNSQNNYVRLPPDYQTASIPPSNENSITRGHSPQQWMPPSQTREEHLILASPTSNTSEETGPSLFQARVGSDRTRAISRSRRTNPDKKLFVCDIPGCGATITSKHNFKSHINSHYGIKPHACGQGRCAKSFGTTAEVKRHRATHCQYRS